MKRPFGPNNVKVKETVEIKSPQQYRKLQNEAIKEYKKTLVPVLEEINGPFVVVGLVIKKDQVIGSHQFVAMAGIPEDIIYLADVTKTTVQRAVQQVLKMEKDHDGGK